MTVKFWRFGSICVLITAFTAFQPAFSADPVIMPSYFQPQNTTQYSGAATLDELSAALFAAVKANDFKLISKFFPGEAELSQLQKSGNKNLQALTEDLTPDQVQSTFRTDFETLIQATTERLLNWPELTLAETTPNRLRSPQATLAPVKMYLAAGEHTAPYYLLYEVVRVKNRYYFFQHITLQKSG